jgi:hypothetical protein
MDTATMRHLESRPAAPARRPKRRWLQRFAIVVGLLALALVLGTRRLPMDPDYQGPVVGNSLPALPHGPRSVEVSFRQERLDASDGWGHVREIWSFEPAGSNATHEPQQVEWYRPATGQSGGPAVLVLPILGGDYPVERIIARHLARDGFSAVLARRTHRFSQYRQVDGLNDLLGDALEGHLRVVDWMSVRPEIDRARIGCLGLSIGAIQGCLVSGVDPRIRATVLGLGGGDLPYILARSRDFDLARRRRKMLEPLGWSIPEYEARLRDEIEWDPLRVASRIDARHALLIQARFDLTIPPSAGMRLREAMGNPETLLLPSGHYDSALFLPVVLREVARFFRQHLGR